VFVSSPEKFADWYNAKIPDACRKITADDVRLMIECHLIGGYRFYGRQDLETVRGVLQYEHLREVWYQSRLGPVKVQRRQYRDGQGKYRYLLDELMGMGKHSHITPGVQELAVELATMMPYRRVAAVLHKTTAIDLTYQTVWRMVGKVADPYQEQIEKELRWFMETGEIPEGEGRQVARLMIEADGVMLSLAEGEGEES
jgi:hypothetical protein